MSKNLVSAQLTIYKLIDKDTKQVVLYNPSLQLSGYGDTEKQAFDIIRFNLDEHSKYLTNLSYSNLQKELMKLGWKKDPFRGREFSNAYVDLDGKLQEFNAEENSVERLSLTTA